jgi:hypothetical protein
VKASQYSVVAFPKLDTEAQIQELRDQFPNWFYRVRPYVPVVLPFTPLTLDEIQSVSEHVGRVRRGLHSFAVSCQKCVERGDSLFLDLDEGRREFVELHASLVGAEPLSLLKDHAAYEPRLWLGRVPDPRQRAFAMTETDRLGRSVGVVDALSLVRIEADGEHKLVAVFPFGIGRVDFYDRFLG